MEDDSSVYASTATGAATGAAFGGPWGAVIGGGIGLAGGLLSNASSARQAQRQMDFQERMSSTAHQREVADLRAAGLNPLLSVNKGAAAPGGAMGQVSNVGEAATSSALQAAQVEEREQQARLTSGQEKNLNQANRLMVAQANQANEAASMHSQSSNLISQQKRTEEQETFRRAYERERARLQLVREAVDSGFYGSAFGKFAREAELTGQAAGEVTGAIGNVFRGSFRTGGPPPRTGPGIVIHNNPSSARGLSRERPSGTGLRYSE